MFKKLDYKIIIFSDTTLDYEKTGYHLDKEIIFKLKEESIITEFSNGESCNITMQELQAINKKCKELGWLDE